MRRLGLQDGRCCDCSLVARTASGTKVQQDARPTLIAFGGWDTRPVDSPNWSGPREGGVGGRERTELSIYPASSYELPTLALEDTNELPRPDGRELVLTR